MTNTEQLNIAILKAGTTKRDLAKTLGLSEMGFYKKVNALTEFKASEIAKLKVVLDLSAEEMTQIFFAEKVELKST